MRRREFIALMGSAAVAGPLVARAERRRDRLLYFTHSAGYRHEVIASSQAVLQRLGEMSGMFEVAWSEDVAEFTTDSLRRYAAVMLFTTGELPMSNAQQAALLDFVRAGGGFVGVHSAIDTFYKWPDYRGLIGGYFNGHPWHQAVRIEVVDPADALVAFLDKSFEIADEIYQIGDFDDRGSHVLLRLDEASVDLTVAGVERRPYGWPLAWTRAYGMGRVFYTALGHEEAVWQDPRYQRLLLNGIRWTMRRFP